MGLQGYIAAKAIIKAIENQDPEALGIKQADVVDEILDKQLGDKRSESVQTILVPWIEKFIKAFNKRLLEDAKK